LFSCPAPEHPLYLSLDGNNWSESIAYKEGNDSISAGGHFSILNDLIPLRLVIRYNIEDSAESMLNDDAITIESNYSYRKRIDLLKDRNIIDHYISIYPQGFDEKSEKVIIQDFDDKYIRINIAGIFAKPLSINIKLDKEILKKHIIVN